MPRSPQSNNTSQLSGQLDTRYTGVPTGGQFSYLLNVEGGFPSVGRLGGWQRYYANGNCPLPGVTNHDLHDQLDGALTSTTGPEYITMLFPFTSVSGRKRLIAGTRTKLMVNDDNGGNWRLLAYGLGGSCVDTSCPSTRFEAAALGNIVVFTNDLDYVMSWEFDTPPIPLQGTLVNWSAKVIPDLLALNVDRAKFVREFKGFVILFNLVMDGVQASSRILWSDYNDARSYFPGGQSLAGYHDLGHGEVILNALPLGGSMMVYTNQAIYRMNLVNDSRVWVFDEVYRIVNDGPIAIPFFRNSVTSTGQEHYWIGADSIYMMTPYDRNPQKVDWIYMATGFIFNGVFPHLLDGSPVSPVPLKAINYRQCDNVIGGYMANINNGSLWFSWPTGDDSCPSVTMILWPKMQKATFVDAGFTAFCNHAPDLRISLRDFIGSFGICDPANSLNPLEGKPCFEAPELITYPSLYNSHKSTAYPMDSNSAIAAMCGVCLETLCSDCTVGPRFLMASTDKTIKQFEPSMYFRERFTSSTPGTWPATSTGTYAADGYYTFAQSMPSNFGTNWEKHFTALMFTTSGPDQTPQGQIWGQLGVGHAPFYLDWWDDDPVYVGYQSGQGGSNVDNGRDGPSPAYRFNAQGNWMSWRLWTFGVGNAFTANDVTVQLELGSRVY